MVSGSTGTAGGTTVVTSSSRGCTVYRR
jgi:hypothetical protein